MYQTIISTEHFSAAPCYQCDLPGYMIVESKTTHPHLSSMPEEVQYELIALLGKIEAAILQVLKPENIYCCKFGEQGQVLHYHLFPRLTEVTEAFLKHYPEQKTQINGPILFNWARLHYRVSSNSYSEKTLSALDKIKSILST